MRMVTEFRGHEIRGDAGEQLRREAAIGLEVTKIMTALARPMRPADVAELPSVRRAISAVEDRIVEALWTLARLPDGRRPDGPNKHGLEYIQDKADRFGNAVSAGGVWDQPAPRPPLPSARAIDAMWEPLQWLQAIDPGQPDSEPGAGFLRLETCKLLTVAAATKRGDTQRRVSWARVVQSMPELTGCSVRTLQRRYEAGLRTIVAELAGRSS